MIDQAQPPASRRTLPSLGAWRFTLGITVLWTIGYSVRGAMQHLRFHTHAFDLGIFAQGTWLLTQFKEPFVTIRGLHLFADHSSYILFLVVPVYAVFPSATTLTVLTVFAMAVSAPIAFVIARRAGAGPFLSALTAMLVLGAPAVQWQVHDSFHPEMFVVPLGLAAVALLQRDRNGWAVAAIAVALTAKEDVALLVVPLGLAVVWIMGKRRVGFVLVGMGLVAFALNFLVLLPAWSPTGELLYSYRYGHLGESPLQILWGLATSPDVWWDTITSGKRLGYVASLVLAMPMAIFGWRWLLAGVPALAANVLSLHGYQYGVQWHYTAYLIVVVAVAGAYGAAKVDTVARSKWRITVVIASLFVPAILWGLAAPITVWAPNHEHPARIAAMLDQIPDDASVSAWTTFVPHLANRDEVYVFPNPWQETNYGAEGDEPPNPSTIEWVAIRMDSYREFDPIIENLTASGDYLVHYEDLPFILLRRSR